jgi:hypothetical protein
LNDTRSPFHSSKMTHSPLTTPASSKARDV